MNTKESPKSENESAHSDDSPPSLMNIYTNTNTSDEMPTPSQETIDTLEAGLSYMSLTPPISPARSSPSASSKRAFITPSTPAGPGLGPKPLSGVGVPSGVGMPFNMNKHELTPVIRNTTSEVHFLSFGEDSNKKNRKGNSYLKGMSSSIPVLRPRNNTVDDCMEALRPVSPCLYNGEVTLSSSLSYQPSRDDSFSSFGLVPDDTVDAIFLPSKSGHEKKRSSFHSRTITKSGALMNEDLDGTDASVETTLSHHSQYSHYSIPSIRLAGRVRCNTQEDSFATIETDDDDGSLLTDEGDDSATIPSIGEDGCIVGWNRTIQGRFFSMSHEEGTASSMEELLNVYRDGKEDTACTADVIGSIDDATDKATASSSSSHHANVAIKRSKSTDEKRKRRCLSSRDKKEVFEWLRTIESRSQDQFAEAASSKFLTGKRTDK